jgi:hypothetical protein
MDFPTYLKAIDKIEKLMCHETLTDEQADELNKLSDEVNKYEANQLVNLAGLDWEPMR